MGGYLANAFNGQRQGRVRAERFVAMPQEFAALHKGDRERDQDKEQLLGCTVGGPSRAKEEGEARARGRPC